MANATAARRPGRKASAAKRDASRPLRKKVVLRYETAPDYRHTVSTGSLVRAERNVIVVTHYIEEMMPTQQVARLKESQESDAVTYELGELEEEPRRLVIAAVRLEPEHAASLATLIAQKVHSIRPDLIPGFDAPPQDAEEKK